jgi:hypothetical protein
MVEVASATILYGIRAKRAQVQDPAYTILEAKKNNSAVSIEPTPRTKIA